MKVCRIDSAEAFTDKKCYGRGHFIKVNKTEALEIIASLANQLSSDSPNKGRVEMYDSDNGYFSISVCE